MARSTKSKADVKGIVVLVFSILFLVAALAVTVVLLTSDGKKGKEVFNFSESSDVRAICELATVRSYYHNVAELEKQPDGLLKYGYGKVGYKQLWLEYSGTVELGIDVNKVVINEPDDNGVVKAYVPPAEILNVNFEKDSMQISAWDTGAFTSITASDEADAFAAAQQNMKEKTAEDSRLFSQAETRAKQLIKAFIVNTGKQLGAEYSVEWIKDTALVE